jgi:hypothetical protein
MVAKATKAATKKLLVVKSVKRRLPRSLVRLLKTEGLIVTGIVKFRSPRADK